MLAGLADRFEDVVRLPRLLQEPEDAGAVDRRDQRGGIGEAGEDDACDVRLEFAHSFQQLDAGHLRHALVGDDHVQRGRFRDLQRFVSGLRLVDAVPGFEEISQDCEVGFLIVYDENPATAGLPNAV